MNIDNLRKTWEQQNNIIESTVEINTNELSKVDVNQHKRKFKQLTLMRVVESLTFLLITLLLFNYIKNNFALVAATVSAGILTLFSIIGLIGSFGQVILINKLDFAAPINILQKNILKIASHKLQFTKIIFMSAPFYLSYTFLGFDIFWGIDFYHLIDERLMNMYLLTSCLFFVIVTFIAIKLNYKNISTPWVKWTIEFLIGKQLVEMSGVVNNLEG